ncbi:hypothetical protein BU26DRAFT_572689 [Trematosphaeria pertusa]|uniref:Uncharacterized protein n=1 Tax=Trematosphaeria pertusa TaxID=390896 RepID=A0A6A6HQR7_9PLEO|nr:uncharacterized protein BU26DRAFT_572689 [Trematosphaeria pertusa]KAF2240504.1 hypothetical protein BU26DRAFT_572689 [Trematosphaeria pertusa]
MQQPQPSHAHEASRKLLGSAALILWGAISPSSRTDEAALNDWWTNEHLPERLRLPGFRRARRYRGLLAPPPSTLTATTCSVAMGGSLPEQRGSEDGSKGKDNGEREGGDGDGYGDESESVYLAVYEVDNVTDLCSEEYMQKLEEPTERTAWFMPRLAGMRRSACGVVESMDGGVGGLAGAGGEEGGGGGRVVGLMAFWMPLSRSSSTGEQTAQRSEDASGLFSSIGDAVFPSGVEGSSKTKEGSPGLEITALHIAQEDEAITQAGSSTKSYHGVRFSGQRQRAAGEAEQNRNEKRCIVLVEFDLRPPLEPLACMAGVMDSLRGRVEREGGREVKWWGFEWICGMRREDVIAG